VGSEALVYAVWDTPVTGSAQPARIVKRDLPSGRERTLLWESNLFPLRGTLADSARLTVLGRDALVFDSTQQLQLIWEQDLAGGSPRPLQRGISHDRQPVYSPDGSRVLFTSNRSGNTDLFAHELASGRLLQITDHPGGDWDGAFSPEGRSILWSSDRGGNLEIWMADADGSNPRQVSHDGIDAENPTMTSDGEWIVYVSGHTEHAGLYKVRPDGSDTTLLLAGVFSTPDVSPDGRHAQYMQTDRTQLFNTIRVVDVGSGEVADFSIQTPYGPEAPNVTYGRGRWLPDGSAIAYVGLDDSGRVGVWAQDFVPGRDTSDTRRPLVPFSEEVIESFGISPDGTRVAMSFLREISALRRAEGLPLS
jgi:Tol biopolymer transport system component